MSAFIFISYSRKDSQFISTITARLHRTGYEIWVDMGNIEGGQLWRESIVEAISSCQVFLILLSPHSVTSKNVRKELDLADKKEKTILPIIAKATEIPASMEYQLAGIQWIDLSSNLEDGLQHLERVLTLERQGTLKNEFTNHLESVISAEQELPDFIKHKRAQVYSHFTKHLWKSSPELRFEKQKMFTLAHLKKMGLTVSQLKSGLKSIQLYEGKIDDVFLPQLATAIVQFQLNNGLEPDGIFGTMTYMKMAAQL